MSRWRTVLRNLALLTIASIVTLLGVEVALRLSVGPDDVFPVVTRYDPLLGWSLIADTAVTARTSEYEVSEWTNSIGTRGPDLSLAKTAGERRILILGDSFAEGYSVRQSSSVGAVLERALDDPMVRVINAGTRGWSTDQELLYFLQNGAAIDPDLTVVLFFVNDVCSNASDRYWRGRKPRFVVRDEAVALDGVPVPPPVAEAAVGMKRRIRNVMDQSALVRLYRRAVVSVPASMGIARAPWSRSLEGHPCLSKGWEITELLLARFRDEVEATGGAFLIFWVPSRESVYDADWEELRATYELDPEAWSPSQDAIHLGQICERQALDCLIPLEEFRAAARATDERLYYRRDPHWTGAGHRLAAMLIEEVARKRLPAGVGSRDALRFP